MFDTVPLLVRYFPALLRLSPAADDQWVWGLLQMAALPSEAARLSEEEVARVLKTHHIRRFTASQVCQVLRQAPLPPSPGSPESCAEHLLSLLPILECLNAQRKKTLHALSALIKEAQTCPEHPMHATVRGMLSLPGLGIQTATTLLAEASHLLAARDYAGLRSYSGVAPVTKQSGKTKRVQMRNGCNQRVREACYHWARVSIQRDEEARRHYQQLREGGHGHGRALRGVCDRLLSILIAISRSGLLYDPNRRLLGRAEYTCR
jgi:transposase